MVHVRTLSTYSNAAITCSAVTFILGTTLFLCALFIGTNSLAAVGFFYLFFAILANGIFFLIVLVDALRPDQPVQETLLALYLLLLNIPIALFYITIIYR